MTLLKLILKPLGSDESGSDHIKVKKYNFAFYLILLKRFLIDYFCFVFTRCFRCLDSVQLQNIEFCEEGLKLYSESIFGHLRNCIV